MGAAGGSDVEHLLRELAPQVLAILTRRHRAFDVAEDAVQEAMIAASTQWHESGIPGNPRGWLYHVAVRRMTDAVRSEIARRRREDETATEAWAEWAFVPAPDEQIDVEQDDTLALLFMCSHPSLTPPTAIALTLRAVGGLTTAEIARAFLVPEATMAQRISRAKQTIKQSGATFEMPDDRELGERLSAVLQVLYLIFNEGYASTSGASVHRTDLSNEAIRLTRMLLALRPDDGEVAGLLALMLLTDARRAARSGPLGEIIPLDEQDRSLWNDDLIREGIALTSASLSSGAPGWYQLQAAIAATHDQAARAEDTNWRQILTLYELLLRMSDNPIVALNHAIAVAMVEGPGRGLELIDALASDERIAGHYRLDAVRGHLYERTGDLASAARHYGLAAERTTSVAEQNYLRLKTARIASPHRGATKT